MKHTLISILLLAAVAAAQDTPKMKKFLTKPLTIEDQGSFLLSMGGGGVRRAGSSACVPAPEPAIGTVNCRLQNIAGRAQRNIV